MDCMCLTVPRRVTLLKGDRALLQDGRWVKTVLVGTLVPGDMVLTQADMAIEKVTKIQAREMKVLMTSPDTHLPKKGE
jgi:hydrogenase maturation factor